MYRSTLAAILVLALTIGGCATQTTAPMTKAPEALGAGDQIAAGQTGADPASDRAASPEPPADWTTEAPTAVSQTPKDLGPPRIKPDKDPRYALPAGQKRTLTIFLGSQTFEYVEDERVVASGQVSTGTREHPTPAGSFRVLSKDANKRSGKYTNYFDENTPMPYSLQFYGPYFVHEGWIPGYADSHGCVRLHYEDARLLFARMRVGDSIQVKPQGAARQANPWADLLPLVF